MGRLSDVNTNMSLLPPAIAPDAGQGPSLTDIQEILNHYLPSLSKQQLIHLHDNCPYIWKLKDKGSSDFKLIKNVWFRVMGTGTKHCV